MDRTENDHGPDGGKPAPEPAGHPQDEDRETDGPTPLEVFMSVRDYLSR